MVMRNYYTGHFSNLLIIYKNRKLEWMQSKIVYYNVDYYNLGFIRVIMYNVSLIGGKLFSIRRLSNRNY